MKNMIKDFCYTHRKVLAFKAVLAFGLGAEHFLPAAIAKKVIFLTNLTWLVAF